MANSLQDFIQRVRARYTTIVGQEPTQQDGAVNAMTGEKTQVDAPVGRAGSRFTGLGPDGALQKDAPAGVVHEGEQVVEADMVRKAGGPNKVRGAIEGLAKSNGAPAPIQPQGAAPNMASPVVPQGTPPVDQPALPGFRRGTGTRVVRRLPGYAEGSLKVPPFNRTMTTQTQLPPTNMPVGQQPPDIQPPDIQPPDIQPPDIQPPPPNNQDPFGADPANIIGTAAGLLQQGAEGQDEGFKKLSDINRMNLAGRQSADVMKQSQAIAQAQKTGGEANAMKADLGRQQSIEFATNEATLLEAQITRSDAFINKLADMGIAIAGLEEAREGRLSNEEYRDKVFAEDIDRWEKTYNLDLSAFQWGQQKWVEEFDLEKQRFGLTVEQFEEFKTQFNETHGLDIKKFDEQVRATMKAEGFTQEQIDLEVEKFGEYKTQFDEQMGLNWAQFEQNKVQFGMDYALRAMTYNFETNNILAQASIAAGDYDAASEFYSLAGVRANVTTVIGPDGLPTGTSVTFDPVKHGIDFTRLEDATVREEFDIALGGVRESILNMGTKVHDIDTFADIPADSPLANDLADMYKAGTGKEPVGADYETWAMNQLDGIRLSQDPYHSAVATLDNSTIESIIEGRGLDSDINTFKFGNATGIEAGRRALVSILAGGGMTITDEGLTYNTDSPVWDLFSPPTIDTSSMLTASKESPPVQQWDYGALETIVRIDGKSVKQGEQFVMDGKVYEVIPLDEVGADKLYYTQVGVAGTGTGTGNTGLKTELDNITDIIEREEFIITNLGEQGSGEGLSFSSISFQDLKSLSPTSELALTLVQKGWVDKVVTDDTASSITLERTSDAKTWADGYDIYYGVGNTKDNLSFIDPSKSSDEYPEGRGAIILVGGKRYELASYYTALPKGTDDRTSQVMGYFVNEDSSRGDLTRLSSITFDIDG